MEEGRGKRRAASLNGHRDASPASVLLHDGTPCGVMVRGRLMQPSEQGAANTVFHNKSITPTGGGSKPRRLSRVSHYALPDSVKGSG